MDFKIALIKIDSSEVQDQLQAYQRTVDLAIMAEKNEGNTTKHLLEEYSVELVKKTAEFRVEITLHKKNVFDRQDNEEWHRCVQSKDRRIQTQDDVYSVEESACLRQAQAAVTVKKHGVKQIVKEIRNWRKGYKYITKVCRDRNLWNRTETGSCIINLMSNDNYTDTVTVLQELLETTQKELRIQTLESLRTLHDCLAHSFSRYLSGLRAMMAELDKCYRRLIDNESSRKSSVPMNAVDCIKHSDLKCVELK